MRKAWVWWAQFLGVLVLPFMLVSGIWEAALLVPGTFKVEQWRDISSFFFLASTVFVVLLLVRSRFHWAARGALAFFALALLLFAAFIVQVRSNCGDEPVFIGSKNDSKMVAQCR